MPWHVHIKVGEQALESSELGDAEDNVAAIANQSPERTEPAVKCVTFLDSATFHLCDQHEQ